MTHTDTTHKHGKRGILQRLRRWLSHPMFEVLPPIFGDPVPPDLRAFEAEMEDDWKKRPEAEAPNSLPAAHKGGSKPARQR